MRCPACQGLAEDEEDLSIGDSDSGDHDDSFDSDGEEEECDVGFDQEVHSDDVDAPTGD